MSRDAEKARARGKRYRDRKKVERYGPGADAIDMRGRQGNHLRSSDHPRWNSDRIMSSHGYVKVRVGQDHPLADPNGYAYEHLLVWVAAGNPPPGPGQTIHHRNEDKTDNRLSNFELLARAEHALHHLAERGRDKAGRFAGASS